MINLELNLCDSQMSTERIKYLQEKVKMLRPVHFELGFYSQLITSFSADFSTILKEKTGKELSENEILTYDHIGGRKMVNVEKYKAKEFSETETITAENLPKEPVTIKAEREVKVTTGPRAGEEALVLEVETKDGLMTYWPNKTSVTAIAEAFGNDSTEWINKKISFEVERMMVRNQKRDVIFAKAEK